MGSSSIFRAYLPPPVPPSHMDFTVLTLTFINGYLGWGSADLPRTAPWLEGWRPNPQRPLEMGRGKRGVGQDLSARAAGGAPGKGVIVSFPKILETGASGSQRRAPGCVDSTTAFSISAAALHPYQDLVRRITHKPAASVPGRV